MLKFMNRDIRDHSKEAIAERKFQRIKGKSLKNILLDRFLNNYGYDKGIITATAIVDDVLDLDPAVNVFLRLREVKCVYGCMLVFSLAAIDVPMLVAPPVNATRFSPPALYY